MRKRTIFFMAAVFALAFVSVLDRVPAALALPAANATINFVPPSCALPGCFGFAVDLSVVQDSACPDDGFFSGTVAETGPGISGTYTFSVSTTACGGTVDFLRGLHPTVGQNVCTLPFAGTHSYEFSGTTFDAVGAPVASFDVTNALTVTPCPPSV